MAYRLTAAQARELAKPSDPEHYIGEILQAVATVAAKGETKLKTYACDFGSAGLYGGKPSELQKQVMEGLVHLGYTVQIRCEERQFVDIWLEVSWAKD